MNKHSSSRSRHRNSGSSKGRSQGASRGRRSGSAPSGTGPYFLKRKPKSTSQFSNKSGSSCSSDSGSRTYRSRGRRRTFKRGDGRSKYTSKTIDIQTFIQKVSLSNSKPRKQYSIEHTFADFGLCTPVKNNLKRQEYITPTPIQDQSIQHIMAGKDIIGLANTGTGKTAAFLLPLIHKIYADKNQKVLIIAPTRELAVQIDSEFRKFASGMRIFSAVCIGGAPMHIQMRSFKRRPNVVIGTPGRLQDIANRKQIRFGDFNSIVLDEVDRMLDMGFIDIIKTILKSASPGRQLLFFSATLPESIKRMVHTFLVDPVTVEVQTGHTTENVSQDVVRVKNREMKFDRLTEILGQPELEKVLIFSETKRDVEHLANKLYRNGFKADSIHGDKRQRQRERSLMRFRNNRVNILVATDVAARGLDIKDVTHVINYTVPQTYDDYVHRIGRTGRGSSKGTALTFI